MPTIHFIRMTHENGQFHSFPQKPFHSGANMVPVWVRYYDPNVP